LLKIAGKTGGCHFGSPIDFPEKTEHPHMYPRCTAKNCLIREQGEAMRLIAKGPALVLIALFVCGCNGDGRTKARGRILKDGAPFQLGEGEGLRIVFAPVAAEGTTYESYPAVFNKDGSFQVMGKDGKGLPPGKYRVSLEHLKKKTDLFNGAFAGDHTPIIREVSNGSGEIIIDLDHPTS
jgi:hypothetical protein